MADHLLLEDGYDLLLEDGGLLLLEDGGTPLSTVCAEVFCSSGCVPSTISAVGEGGFVSPPVTPDEPLPCGGTPPTIGSIK